MKLLFVLDTFGGGGKERRCLQLIQGLNEKGYEDIFVIIINNEIAYKELLKTNSRLVIIDRKNRGLNFFETLSELYRHTRDFNPDIVQVWGVLSAFYMNLVYLFSNFKLIGSYVADCNAPKFFSVHDLTIRLNILLADRIIGNSKAGINAYKIPSRKAAVIYNGFNSKRLDISSVESNSLISSFDSSKNFIVSMIARIDENKDQLTFINAAKIILIDRNDIHFLIVGDGPLSNNLREQVNEKKQRIFTLLVFRRKLKAY